MRTRSRVWSSVSGIGVVGSATGLERFEVEEVLRDFTESESVLSDGEFDEGEWTVPDTLCGDFSSSIVISAAIVNGRVPRNSQVNPPVRR